MNRRSSPVETKVPATAKNRRREAAESAAGLGRLLLYLGLRPFTPEEQVPSAALPAQVRLAVLCRADLVDHVYDTVDVSGEPRSGIRSWIT